MMVDMTVLPEERRDPVMSEVKRLLPLDRPLVIDNLDQLLELESSYRFPP